MRQSKKISDRTVNSRYSRFYDNTISCRVLYRGGILVCPSTPGTTFPYPCFFADFCRMGLANVLHVSAGQLSFYAISDAVSAVVIHNVLFAAFAYSLRACCMGIQSGRAAVGFCHALWQQAMAVRDCAIATTFVISDWVGAIFDCCL